MKATYDQRSSGVLAHLLIKRKIQFRFLDRNPIYITLGILSKKIHSVIEAKVYPKRELDPKEMITEPRCPL